MELILTNVRLSYPHLFKPKAVNNGAPKYSAAFILDKVKDKTQIEKAKKIIEAVKAENKGKKVDADKVFLKDGANKEETYGDDVFYINAGMDPEGPGGTVQRPQVVNRNRSPVTAEDDVIYGGCYVNAVLNVWFQDNSWGKRINAGLEVVQFVKDGERFGRKPVDVNEKLPDLSGEIQENDPLA